MVALVMWKLTPIEFIRIPNEGVRTFAMKRLTERDADFGTGDFAFHMSDARGIDNLSDHRVVFDI
jgi:hypothetical protein